MNRTLHTIAQALRKDIGADYRLICARPAGSVTQTGYLAAVARSQQAMSTARYLTQHLAGINRQQFAAACGIRWSN